MNKKFSVLTIAKSRFSTMIALLAALMLSLSVTTTALAAPLANGSFENSHGTCSLSGWTTSGSVSVVTGTSAGLPAGDSCVAKVTAFLSNYIPDVLQSSLSQTFTVPTGSGTNDQLLHFKVWAKSTNGVEPPNGSCYNMAQRIMLYNSGGSLIVGNGHNYDTYRLGYFQHNLSAYAGQNVTLRVETNVSTSNGCSPTNSTLYVDQMDFGTFGVPQGMITFGW